MECVTVSGCMMGKETKMYIANSYGNYSPDSHFPVEHQNNFLMYSNVSPEYNTRIAGIHNDDKTIFGMMPHPERNNNNFKDILYKIIFPKSHIIHTQLHFSKKNKRINE